jgi:hypothetical protein
MPEAGEPEGSELNARPPIRRSGAAASSLRLSKDRRVAAPGRLANDERVERDLATRGAEGPRPAAQAHTAVMRKLLDRCLR